jgi:hypothetical protein
MCCVEAGPSKVGTAIKGCVVLEHAHTRWVREEEDVLCGSVPI